MLRATLAGTRFCADMMVSGHTNSAALFSLASYKLAEHHSAASPPCVILPLARSPPLMQTTLVLCVAILYCELHNNCRTALKTIGKKLGDHYAIRSTIAAPS